MRPDLAEQLVNHLQTEPTLGVSPLEGLSIGELGVVYEALSALGDPKSRKAQGQYFTPDDVATFMSSHAVDFPAGTWLDPCCGVGNLSWHIATAMEDPGEFIADRLTLIDQDPLALTSALAILVASFAEEGDLSVLPRIAERSAVRDFLSEETLPQHDYAIFNPPYAATTKIARFKTSETRELYAYFMERILRTSRGFIAITPASFLSARKFDSLRELLIRRRGDVYVFDNVPDTCFRGYKYGSANSSRTNFVRAAITVSYPAGESDWRITPIIRWASRSRAQMWKRIPDLLGSLRRGPHGQWVKLMPETQKLWDLLAGTPVSLRDLTTREETRYRLSVASTPRYYISAAIKDLDRGSKHTLYFRSQKDLHRAYLVLNSSLAYWWWRCLDGGVTLTRSTLLSLPVPPAPPSTEKLVDSLLRSEHVDLVTKLNAGRQNENVRRPRELVDRIDRALLPGANIDFSRVYSSDMFQSPVVMHS